MGRTRALTRTPGPERSRGLVRLLVGLPWVLLWTAPLAAQTDPGEYEAACGRGDHVACAVLGLLYEEGDGVARDPGRAAALFREACEADEPSGCSNLGRMYAAGSGVPRDAERARELFALACRQGDRWACDQLAPGDGSEVPGGFFKSGRVGDAETALPLAGAVVEIPSLGIRVSTDESGRFALRGLPEGRYRLRVERLGYQLLSGAVDVPGERALLLLLVREPSDEPGAPGRIVGRVADVEGGPLPDVEVAVDGQPDARAVTTGAGRFTLSGVTPGLARVRFQRLGYAPREVELVIRPGRTSEVSVDLATRPIQLDPIEVTVRSSYLERTGFYRRSRSGAAGTRFDRADIEDLDPIVLSDLLRRVPGVRTRYTGGTTRAVTWRRFDRGECTLSVRVDGVQTWGSDLDWLPPEQVEAVEVYHGLSMPIEYTSRFGDCGVVLIWTRRR